MTTYRYGREEDEVMGLKFSKEMVIGQEQVVPLINSKMELTPVQEKLLKKLGPNAFPFTFNFPELAPSSVKYNFFINNSFRFNNKYQKRILIKNILYSLGYTAAR